MIVNKFNNNNYEFKPYKQCNICVCYNLKLQQQIVHVVWVIKNITERSNHFSIMQTVTFSAVYIFV
jgi:hypothetical protein